METIGVVFDPGVADDRTIHVPTTRTDVPPRALVRQQSDPAKRAVVRMRADRPGSPVAAASMPLFTSLGGQGSGTVTCTYEKASTWTLLRHDDGAATDAVIAVVGGTIAAVAAWAALDKATGEDAGLLVPVLVFAATMLVAVLKLRKELRDLG